MDESPGHKKGWSPGGLEQGQGGPGAHHLPESEGTMESGWGRGLPWFSLCFCSL